MGGAGAIEPFPTGVFVDSARPHEAAGPAANFDPAGSFSRSGASVIPATAVRGSRQRSARSPWCVWKSNCRWGTRLANGPTKPCDYWRACMRSSTCLSIRSRVTSCWPDRQVIGARMKRAASSTSKRENRYCNWMTWSRCCEMPTRRKGGLAVSSSHGPRIWLRHTAFQQSWNNRPIKPKQREEWLEQLRAALGKQDIKVWGIDPGTRTARVLVEADYRMKLVGMGLEDGTLGVSSYLDEVKRSGEAPPAMNVLRWWFTLNYEHVNATAARDAFELCGPGVKVLSENELLTETGERIHTGKSDELTAGFARSFTQHIDMLAAKYPIYAELKNVFDLALVAGLLKSHDLPAQVGWHLTYFGDQRGFPLTLGPCPKEVDSVINSVTLDRSRFIAGVSGGVSVDTGPIVARQAVVSDEYGVMDASRVSGQPEADLPPDAWWWD